MKGERRRASGAKKLIAALRSLDEVEKQAIAIFGPENGGFDMLTGLPVKVDIHMAQVKETAK